MNNPFLLHRHHAVIAVLAAAMLGLAATSGCAKAPRSSSLARDISPMRETRGAEALQSFEEFRTQAQFQAACARWQDGDPKTCEQMLQAVLTRTSDHYQARLTLADLYAATDRPELAEQELQNLLERDPHDPQAHHSLGLLLESTGRNHEALTHFQMAVKFDPKNELYSASEETMLTATRPSSPNTFAPDKPAGPAMASLRDVSPRLASTPRSQIKMVAHHESQKSPKLPSPISPTKRTTAIINDVEAAAAGDESAILPPPLAKDESDASAAPRTPSVPPIVFVAPEPPSEPRSEASDKLGHKPDDKPATIHFRVQSE